MRIKHKYLRNRHVYKKIWKRVRAKEHPYRTYCPCKSHYWICSWRDHEEQVRDHFKWIDEQARYAYNGSHRVAMDFSSAEYRRILNAQRRAKEKAAMDRINQGDYDAEVPVFKRDAAWNYW